MFVSLPTLHPTARPSVVVCARRRKATKLHVFSRPRKVRPADGSLLHSCLPHATDIVLCTSQLPADVVDNHGALRNQTTHARWVGTMRCVGIG